MRILNQDTNNSVKNVILYLKPEEAKELYDSIGMLLEDGDFERHEHVCDVSYKHELTVVLYDDEHMGLLDARYKN